MKAFFLTIIILISISCSSQNGGTAESELNKKANSYLDALYSHDKDYLPSDIDRINVKDQTDITEYCVSNAFQIFKQLSDTYPNSADYAIYLYYVAKLSGDVKEKKDFFTKVVNLNSKWGYYKRYSYICLASIAVEEKDFEKGMSYLKIIEKLPQPSFTCGVERENYDAQLKRLYTACEIGLKK